MKSLFLGCTMQQLSEPQVTLRVFKDRDGWATSLIRRSGLVAFQVERGYRLRGIALEMQTVMLLHKLAEYGVRAKLLLAFLGVMA